MIQKKEIQTNYQFKSTFITAEQVGDCCLVLRNNILTFFEPLILHNIYLIFHVKLSFTPIYPFRNVNIKKSFISNFSIVIFPIVGDTAKINGGVKTMSIYYKDTIPCYKIPNIETTQEIPGLCDLWNEIHPVIFSIHQYNPMMNETVHYLDQYDRPSRMLFDPTSGLEKAKYNLFALYKTETDMLQARVWILKLRRIIQLNFYSETYKAEAAAILDRIDNLLELKDLTQVPQLELFPEYKPKQPNIIEFKLNSDKNHKPKIQEREKLPCTQNYKN